MFCSECGEKNNNDSLYCSNCGNKLKKNKQINNIITYIIIGVIFLLIILYFVISNSLSPKNIAQKYFNSVTTLNSEKLMNYLDIEESEFTTKKMFEKILDSKSKVDVLNYNVDEVEFSSDKMNSTVTIKYLLKETKETKTFKVNLVKTKKKKFLIFDNWKINTNDFKIINNYKIKLPKGSKITIEGKKVNKKYISESKNGIDVYTIPSIFRAKYNISVEIFGIKINQDIQINNNEYNFIINESNIEEKSKEKLNKTIKSDLDILYNSAINKKNWDEIKSKFKNDLKSIYNNLLSKLSNSNTILEKIDFTKIEISRASINNNGQLYLTVKASYNYKISYNYLDEVKTNESNNYDYVYLTYDNSLKLVDATSLNTYFSRYF